VTEPTVGAVILAAGAGERLGGPKLRQGAGGRTFLERVLATVVAAGCAPVVCVVRAADRDWAAAQVESAGGAVVVNPAPERGALSSLRLGLDRLGACTGALVAPVDHPFVAAATCRALVAAFAARTDAVVKPVWEGRSGHPVIIPRELFPRIPEAVQLVIQAGAIGLPGDVLVLDMGEPVRILDVARRLIWKSGKDIEIVYTGLRPGEKLTEALFSAHEGCVSAGHPLINKVHVPPLDPQTVRSIPSEFTAWEPPLSEIAEVSLP